MVVGGGDVRGPKKACEFCAVQHTCTAIKSSLVPIVTFTISYSNRKRLAV